MFRGSIAEVFYRGKGEGGGGGDVVIDVIMYAETRAAIVHFDFQCNKVDTVRLYASYRLNYFS